MTLENRPSSGIIQGALETGVRMIGAVPVALAEAIAPSGLQRSIGENRATMQKWSGAVIAGIGTLAVV